MIAVNVPSGLMMVFNGATCYPFPDWAMLQVKGVDYVYVGTIRFGSLSDHTWLYFPCRFFCCLECHVNRILPLLSSSVRTDVLFVRWKELVGLLLLFLQFSCEWPQLLTWCFFFFSGENFECYVHVARQAEIPCDDSWRFMSESIWSFHQFRTSLVWSMSLSVEENLRKARSSLWTDHAWPGWVLYHCVSLTQCETHIDVARRYSRAEVGMTFTVSASLLMMRPTL